MAESGTIIVNKIPKNFVAVVTVKPTKRFYVRVWIAKLLIKIAISITGMGYEFKEE